MRGSVRVRVAAALTAVMGVLNVTSGATPSTRSRVEVLREFFPLIVRHGGHLATVLAGFALLLLAVNLARRKHAAWALTEAVLLISAASHLVKGLDVEEATVALLLALFLYSHRHEYHALSDPPSVRQGLWGMAGAMAFTLFYGVVGFWLLDRHFSVNFGLWAAVRQTVIMFTQLSDPGLEPVTRFGRWFADSIYGVSIATGGWALAMLVRPVLLRQPPSEAEKERARAVVEEHGQSSLARLVLMDDKSFYFTPGGSVIAFVVKGRVALALGDPIGPDDDRGGAIRAFVDRCARHDWTPAFYQVFGENLACYREAGLDALCIGHEAIVDLAGFSLEGRPMKSLRGAVNRVARAGVRAVLREPPLDDRLLAEMRAVSDDWLEAQHGTEKRFSLGWFDEDYLRPAPVMTMISDRGLLAFANLVTEYRRNELTVDLMRERRDAGNGVMEALLVELFHSARAQGYDTFNLGLSPLAGVGLGPDAPGSERAVRFLYEHMERFYSFRGIHEFKDKFGPRWEPRYLVHPGAPSLPEVGLALVLADSGTSTFWPWRVRRAPRVRTAPRPHAPPPAPVPG